MLSDYKPEQLIADVEEFLVKVCYHAAYAKALANAREIVRESRRGKK